MKAAATEDGLPVDSGFLRRNHGASGKGALSVCLGMVAVNANSALGEPVLQE